LPTGIRQETIGAARKMKKMKANRCGAARPCPHVGEAQVCHGGSHVFTRSRQRMRHRL